MRRVLAVLLAALVALAGCSTEPEEETGGGTTTTDGSDTTASSAPESDDPRAPGVTEDAIKVGVTYPDLSTVKEIIGIDQGDYEAAYRAVADGINASGGVNGRKLELVFAPVNPTVGDAPTAACTRLTRDEEVFVVVGFALGDETMCYVESNETPVIMGGMDPESLEQAKVAWFSVGGSQDAEGEATDALLEEGILGDNVGVISSEGGASLYDSLIGPKLEEAGVAVVGPAYFDTTSGDANVVFANIDTILDRFEAEGVEQLLVVGQGTGLTVGPRVAARSYSPQLIFTRLDSGTGYISAEGADLSAAQEAIAAGPFDTNNEYVDMDNESTTECVQFLEDGGHTPLRPSSEVPEGEPDNIVSGMIACNDLYLLKAILENVDGTLDFGSFKAAGESLGEVQLPGLPDPATYGPPPGSDGDLPQYLYDYDAATNSFVRREG